MFISCVVCRSSALVGISSELVRISSEPVQISSELVLRISELLKTSTFKKLPIVVSRTYVSVWNQRSREMNHFVLIKYFVKTNTKCTPLTHFKACTCFSTQIHEIRSRKQESSPRMTHGRRMGIGIF